MKSYAQTKDSITLKFNDYISWVKKFHPLANIAQLGIENANADFKISKSGFDPVITSTLDDKTLDRRNYYHISESQLKVPIWPGIEFKAGYDQIEGNSTDPQLTLGQSSYMGISVPLLKNLIMDKKRAMYLKAQNKKNISQFEQQNILNDLIYDATITYLQWSNAYEQYQLSNQILVNNQNRYNLIVQSIKFGERPGIDSIEAKAQLFQLKNITADYLMNAQILWWYTQNYIFNDSFNFSLNNKFITPDLLYIQSMTNDSFEFKMITQESVMKLHPIINAYQWKLQNSFIDKKLYRQNLLPTLNVQYNFITKNILFVDYAPQINNYKLGMQFYFPIRQSEAKGEYQKSLIAIQEIKNQLKLKETTLNNKYRSYIIEYYNYKNMLQTQNEIVQLNQTVFNGEISKFNQGESTQFLINSRELKYFEVIQKSVDLKYKMFKSMYSAKWSTGQLNNLF